MTNIIEQLLAKLAYRPSCRPLGFPVLEIAPGAVAVLEATSAIAGVVERMSFEVLGSSEGEPPTNHAIALERVYTTPLRPETTLTPGDDGEWATEGEPLTTFYVHPGDVVHLQVRNVWHEPISVSAVAILEATAPTEGTA